MERRDFLKSSVSAGVGLSVLSSTYQSTSLAQEATAKPAHPVVISSGNGLNAVTRAMERIKGGSDPLDAVIAGVNLVEDDPEDMSVGYGGLPNEEGVVQLDSSVMHGPTHNAGAVAAIENIKNPSKVAKLVMERTDHVLLVGEGALRFARAHGFEEEDLLTDRAREIWLSWKENLDDRDDWLPAKDDQYGDLVREYREHYGTINCCAVDTNGDLGGVTTTSGLSFKIPGRVGDSPIIGAGLFVDNEVGAAGSTGRGEANLKNLCSFMVVEFMRMGKSPEEACLATCQRIADHTRLPYLLKDDKPAFNVKFYAVNKRGDYGSASIFSGGDFCVADASGSRKEASAYLYKTDDANG